ncbi:MAG: AAA family ATPase [Candidatus Azambacteria bacterium]|nr:AAA family ATPase [Candidatus Azambacteria bacterium]
MNEHSQLTLLTKSFREGTHAHAYLFCGGSGDEKKEVARAFAALATEHEGGGSMNPDVLMVEAQSGEDKVLVGQIRQIREFFSLASYFGGHKVVIIDAFDRLGNTASSALLKILEEPPAKSVIILLSDHPTMILPTILSRVQKVRFSGSEQTDEAIDKKKQIVYDLRNLIIATIARRFAMTEKMAKDEDSDISDILTQWASFFRDMSYLIAGGDKKFLEHGWCVEDVEKLVQEKNYSLTQLRDIISEIIRSAHIAKTSNANKRLILENIVLMF